MIDAAGAGAAAAADGDWPQARLVNRLVTWAGTAFLTAVAGMAIAMSAFSEQLRPTRLGAVMFVLLATHLFWRGRLFWCREFTIYLCYFGYMLLALLWTHDDALAMNTLVPATNFIIIVVFFSSMLRFHEIRAALTGAVLGFSLTAASYTLTQGFPFAYPQDFSYNAIAGMYLFGLFVTLMLSCFARHVLVWLALAAVIMVHIVATTSIKTNLGIALGLLAAGSMYTRHFGRLLRRRALILLPMLAALPFIIATNDSMLDTIQRGADRVMLGIEVLQAREDVPGYSAYEERSNWRAATCRRPSSTTTWPICTPRKPSPSNGPGTRCAASPESGARPGGVTPTPQEIFKRTARRRLIAAIGNRYRPRRVGGLIAPARAG